MQSTARSEATTNFGASSRWAPYRPGALYNPDSALLRKILVVVPLVAIIVSVVLIAFGIDSGPVTLWALRFVVLACGAVVITARDTLIRGRMVLFSRNAVEYAVELPSDTVENRPTSSRYNLNYPLLRLPYGAWRWVGGWSGEYIRPTGITPLSLRVEFHKGIEVIAWKLGRQVLRLPPHLMLRLLEMVEESQYRSMRVALPETMMTLFAEHDRQKSEALARIAALEADLATAKNRAEELRRALSDALEVGGVMVQSYAQGVWVKRHADTRDFRNSALRALHGLAIVLEGKELVDRAFEPHHLSLARMLNAAYVPSPQTLLDWIRKQEGNCANLALLARDCAVVAEKCAQEEKRREVGPQDVQRPGEA